MICPECGEATPPGPMDVRRAPQLAAGAVGAEQRPGLVRALILWLTGR
jgi:hypothetical protein